MDSPISEEQPPPPLPHQSPRREEPPKECFHKTKTIQFFSRTTPIILQDDNGPCPLLAICNVLLLRNQLNLSADISGVSQEKLLSLVAERLIDSNSNIDNEDAEYVQNRQQNISDAIDLLPRLTTGIDVNIKFQRIGDFEFTRECAIFDLLDIPLYHGWLVDPQDYETKKAIGSKSYNTITRELVSLQEMVGKAKDKSQEDCVDFAAATAVTLGVPSPCLSIAKPFNDSPRVFRKGNFEEEQELLRVLKLSENESSIGESNSIAAGSNGENVIVSSNENLHQMQTAPTSSIDEPHLDDHNGKVHGEPSVSSGTDLSYSMNDLISFEEPDRSSANETKPSDQFSVTQSEGSLLDDLTIVATGTWSQYETKPSPYSEIDFVSIHDQDTQLEYSTDDHNGKVHGEPSVSGGTDLSCSRDDLISFEEPDRSSANETKPSDQFSVTQSGGSWLDDLINLATGTWGQNETKPSPYCGIDFVSIHDQDTQLESSTDDLIETLALIGHEHPASTILDADHPQIHSPLDAGLGEEISEDEITPEEGERISNFLKCNASQLTVYGLFSLQDGLKERELCVFFRNNHFCTMFKFEGELHLLTTDQGYLNQPGIVWEKLNEVNGDSVFYDSDFKEFRPETQATGSWDERNVVASTTKTSSSLFSNPIFSQYFSPQFRSDLEDPLKIPSPQITPKTTSTSTPAKQEDEKGQALNVSEEQEGEKGQALTGLEISRASECIELLEVKLTQRSISLPTEDTRKIIGVLEMFCKEGKLEQGRSLELQQRHKRSNRSKGEKVIVSISLVDTIERAGKWITKLKTKHEASLSKTKRRGSKTKRRGSVAPSLGDARDMLDVLQILCLSAPSSNVGADADERQGWEEEVLKYHAGREGAIQASEETHGKLPEEHEGGEDDATMSERGRGSRELQGNTKRGTTTMSEITTSSQADKVDRFIQLLQEKKQSLINGKISENDVATMNDLLQSLVSVQEAEESVPASSGSSSQEDEPNWMLELDMMPPMIDHHRKLQRVHVPSKIPNCNLFNYIEEDEMGEKVTVFTALVSNVIHFSSFPRGSAIHHHHFFAKPLYSCSYTVDEQGLSALVYPPFQTMHDYLQSNDDIDQFITLVRHVIEGLLHIHKESYVPNDCFSRDRIVVFKDGTQGSLLLYPPLECRFQPNASVKMARFMDLSNVLDTMCKEKWKGEVPYGLSTLFHCMSRVSTEERVERLLQGPLFLSDAHKIYTFLSQLYEGAYSCFAYRSVLHRVEVKDWLQRTKDYNYVELEDLCEGLEEWGPCEGYAHGSNNLFEWLKFARNCVHHVCEKRRKLYGTVPQTDAENERLERLKATMPLMPPPDNLLKFFEHIKPGFFHLLFKLAFEEGVHGLPL